MTPPAGMKFSTTLLLRLIALTLMFSAKPDPPGLALVWISGVLWGYTYGP